MDMVISFPGGKKVDAYYKYFVIRTDQSTHNGGNASAPAPFDLFLASIGTCAGIYVLSFCQQRNIPAEKIKLVQKIDRNEKTKMVEKIVIEIQLPPEFPEKYRDAVVRSAQLCTVKKHLFAPPEFSVTAITAEQECQRV